MDRIEKEGSKYIGKVKDNQPALFDKADEISRTKEPSSVYKKADISQSNVYVNRKISVYTNDCCFYHDGMTHIRSIIRTDKYVELINTKTGEITKRKSISFCIANFREDAQFFHDAILKHWKVETMHFFKDTSFLEDKHNAYINPMTYTITRSFALNTMLFNGFKKIRETMTNFKFSLVDSLVSFLRVI